MPVKLYAVRCLSKSLGNVFLCNIEPTSAIFRIEKMQLFQTKKDAMAAIKQTESRHIFLAHGTRYGLPVIDSIDYDKPFDVVEVTYGELVASVGDLTGV